MDTDKWPFEYYPSLNNIFLNTGISLYYVIDTDEILDRNDIDNMENYRITDRYFICGTRNSINKLYYELGNILKIHTPINYVFDINKVILKYSDLENINKIPDDILLQISLYLQTKDMLNLSFISRDVYKLLLNDEINMRKHVFTLRNNIKSLHFISELPYNIRNLDLNTNKHINDVVL